MRPARAANPRGRRRPRGRLRTDPRVASRQVEWENGPEWRGQDPPTPECVRRRAWGPRVPAAYGKWGALWERPVAPPQRPVPFCLVHLKLGIPLLKDACAFPLLSAFELAPDRAAGKVGFKFCGRWDPGQAGAWWIPPLRVGRNVRPIVGAAFKPLAPGGPQLLSDALLLRVSQRLVAGQENKRRRARGSLGVSVGCACFPGPSRVCPGFLARKKAAGGYQGPGALGQG